jgi:heme-degrading monooxygenase HmoA
VDGTQPAGPEQAAAVLVLQGTLVSEDAAQSFWQRAAVTLREAMDSPGFIRFIGFNDGLCGYALGFWRSAEDAEAFAKGRAHGDARKELYRVGNQYTHFAGLFNASKAHKRHFFCEACGAVTDAPAQACGSCGNPLVDVFDSYVRPSPEPAAP